MGGYAVAFLIAALGTAGLSWPAKRMAERWGIVAEPDGTRRVHERPTPVLGGAAMSVACLVALVVASRLGQFHEVFLRSEPIGVALGVVIIVAIGTVDDIFELSPPAKLAGQVLAGSAMYFQGVSLYFFRLPVLDVVVLSRDLAPLLSVLWVVGMANAVNFIDGIDGLAAGVVGIGAAAFFVYSHHLFDLQQIAGDNMGPLLAVIVCGLCVGFLPWNWSPARMFMGDSGAMLLGLLMASSTMVVGGRADAPSGGQTYFFLAPLLIPFLIMGVPILDTILAIIRRTARGTAPMIADREHLHHRLLEWGHGPRRAVVILWSLTAILSGFVLVPTYLRTAWAFVPLVLGLLATAAFALLGRDRPVKLPIGREPSTAGSGGPAGVRMRNGGRPPS